MNAAVKSALMAIDVPAHRIHRESYGGASQTDTSVEGVASRMTLRLGGKIHDLSIAQGQTVLEASELLV